MVKGHRRGLPDKYGAPFLTAILAFLCLFGYSQTYQPGIHVPVNDAIGQGAPAPLDGRTMYWDGVNFLYRPFASTSEVISYFPNPNNRVGNYIIVVDSGGTLQSNGKFLNGHNVYYMWADTTSNAGLVKLNLFGANGCSGCLLAANNLNDLTNKPQAIINLGLGTMATQNVAAGGDLSGNWNNITVSKFNGQLPSYYLAYGNLTGTPAPLALTTTGTSGLATYNPGTGVLNIPNYSGSGGSCLNCNADTIGHIPLNFTSFPNGSVLTLDSAAGYAYWAPASGGVATLPPNSGSGYRIYSPQIPGIRTLVCNSGCTIDSTSNTGSLTFNITGGSVGTVTSFSAVNITGFATQGVTNATTTPQLTYTLINAPAYNIWGNNTASPTAPFYFAPNATILNQWFGGTIAAVPSAGLVYSNGTILADVTVDAPLIYSLGVLSADTATGSQNLATQGWATRNTANTVSNSDGTLTISPTSGAVVASLALGHTNTWTATQTFNGMTIAGAAAFSATNTWSIGGSADVAAHMWSRIFNSDASAVLSATTGNAASLSIGINPGITLLSTGQAQLNNYVANNSFTGSGIAFIENDGSGNLVQIPIGNIATQTALNDTAAALRATTSLFYPVQLLSPIGNSADSFALGGVAGPAFQNDSLYFANNKLFIYNLNASFSTLVAGDSVMVHGSGGQVKFLPSSAIGGGGAVSSVSDNGGGTLTISPNTGAVLAGINLANSNTWTATNNSFKNILPSATTTYSLGSTGAYWNNVYTNNLDVNNILPPSNLLIQLATGQSMQTAINGVTKEELLSTGQKQFNGYTTTSSFPVTSVGMLVFDASGNIGTAAISSGGVPLDAAQTYTSGSTLTITNGNNILIVNPSSTQATLAVTLPATPHTGNRFIIETGPATSSLTNAVTTFSVLPNTSQSIDNLSGSFVLPSGATITLIWNPSTSAWHVESRN